jgi:hypothetical protein
VGASSIGRVPVAVLLALSLLGADTAAAASPAPVTRTCRLTATQQQNAGATYLVQLKVTGVNCATGLKLEKAWQSCRRATTGRRTCRKPVLGYSSKQTILDSSRAQYDARVTAKNGSRVVSFIYMQNK